MGWKVISTRWININTGDTDNPNYRSMLVVKVFNDGVQNGRLFATPPRHWRRSGYSSVRLPP